jgi:L-lysine exporter family protein LysE/ArgO
VILALLKGLFIGFAGAIPVGPVNAAVIDTSLRKCFKRAFALGLGGAFVDFMYSQIAVSGLAPLMERFPGLKLTLLGVGGIVLVIFGVMQVKTPIDRGPPPPERPVETRALLASFMTGVLITVTNPAALVSWVLVAGAALASMTRLEAFVAGLGIFIGTSIWFFAISWLAAKGRVRLGHKAQWITRTVGAFLVIYGVFLVGKASLEASVVWAHR